MGSHQPIAKAVAIVLAAGESRRLGRPKQLIVLDDQALVVRAVRSARTAGFERVLVVTGAYAAEVAAAVAAEGCEVVHNSDWREGLGSTIRRGATCLQTSAPTPSAILLLLCDQPMISAAHLGRLLAAATALPSRLAATEYPDGEVGVPACFPGEFLDVLASFSGPTGAKKLIQENPVARVPAELAAVDIDTEADLADLKRRTT